MFFLQTNDSGHVCDWDPRAGLAFCQWGSFLEAAGPLASCAAELALCIGCHLPLPGTQMMKQKYLALLCLLLMQLTRGADISPQH